MDTMGHVNNTLYFRYFEQARIAWFESLGFMARPDGEGCILARITCDFVRPLTYPGDVVVRHRLIKLGRTSVTHELEIRRVDEDALYAKGDSVLVWMDFRANQSKPWPQHLRDILDV
jgi:acyl-CoA thioester hydrolase